MSAAKNPSPQVGLPIRREALDKSSSLAVVHDSTVYLTAVLPNPELATVAEQTQDILDRIDAVLAQFGTGKHRMVHATIYCADSRHLDEINTRWDAWVPWHDPPACAYMVAKLQSSRHKLAIQIVCGL